MTRKASEKRRKFDSAKSKIERAKFHINDLNAKIAAFYKLQPYRLTVEKHPQSGELQVIFREHESIPADFALVAGDAVHNLRCALDHLAVELVNLNGGNTKSVYFPFSTDARSLQSAIKDRHIDRAGPKVIKIVEALRPYHLGNDFLRLVCDFDNADKHSRLALVMNFVGEGEINTLKSRGALIKERGLIGVLSDGMLYATLTSLGDLKVGDEITSPATICLREGDPFQFFTLLAALDEMTKVVEGVVAEFERSIT